MLNPRHTLTPLQEETLALLLPDDQVVMPKRYRRTAARLRTMGWVQSEEDEQKPGQIWWSPTPDGIEVMREAGMI